MHLVMIDAELLSVQIGGSGAYKRCFWMPYGVV
jgi:hypothetical protein